jgi:hypothetical protein
MEMIIALAISSMIILACYSFISTGTKSYYNSRNQSKIQQEMMIANNFISDVIMEADILAVKFKDVSDSAVLYTDKYILYFDKDKKVFCMYEKSEEAKVGTEIEDHLITDCMENFMVTFEKTTTRDDDISLNPEEPTTAAGDGSSSILAFANSHLVKVETSFKVKGMKQSSVKRYVIRN